MIVCGEPQLFWLTKDSHTGQLSGNAAKVKVFASVSLQPAEVPRQNSTKIKQIMWIIDDYAKNCIIVQLLSIT